MLDERSPTFDLLGSSRASLRTTSTLVCSFEPSTEKDLPAERRDLPVVVVTPREDIAELSTSHSARQVTLSTVILGDATAQPMVHGHKKCLQRSGQ